MCRPVCMEYGLMQRQRFQIISPSLGKSQWHLWHCDWPHMIFNFGWAWGMLKRKPLSSLPSGGVIFSLTTSTLQCWSTLPSGEVWIPFLACAVFAISCNLTVTQVINFSTVKVINFTHTLQTYRVFL